MLPRIGCKCFSDRMCGLSRSPYPLFNFFLQLQRPRFSSRHAFAMMICLFMALANAHGQTQSAGTSPALHLRIVGGLAGLNQYTRHEEPFWSKDLARLSGGKYSAEIAPFDRAGVPPSDMLRLLKLGVVPFGTVLLHTVEKQYPQYSAADLAGLNLDMASLKKNVAAFRPYLEHDLRINHNIEMLALYVHPAQVVFCKQAFGQLTDLKGRRIRVAAPTQADFVRALGATPVTTGFTQIKANLTSGNIDCAITGTMSGNTIGLHEVTHYIHAMPITWGLAVFAANATAWNALPPDLRSLLGRELPKLEAAIWRTSEQETAEGLACNSGSADCSHGQRGQMQQVAITAKDAALSQSILRSVVLPDWLAHCNATPCLDIWNKTIGPTSGIQLTLPPKATP